MQDNERDKKLKEELVDALMELDDALEKLFEPSKKQAAWEPFKVQKP